MVLPACFFFPGDFGRLRAHSWRGIADRRQCNIAFGYTGRAHRRRLSLFREGGWIGGLKDVKHPYLDPPFVFNDDWM